MKNTVEHIYPVANTPEEEEEDQQTSSSSTVMSTSTTSLVEDKKTFNNKKQCGKTHRRRGWSSPWSSPPKVRVYQNRPANNSNHHPIKPKTNHHTAPSPNTEAADDTLSASTPFWKAWSISILQPSEHTPDSDDSGMEVTAQYIGHDDDDEKRADDDQTAAETTSNLIGEHPNRTDEDHHHRSEKTEEIIGENHNRTDNDLYCGGNDEDDDDDVILIPAQPHEIMDQESYVETIQKYVTSWKPIMDVPILISEAAPEDDCMRDHQEHEREKSVSETNPQESLKSFQNSKASHVQALPTLSESPSAEQHTVPVSMEDKRESFPDPLNDHQRFMTTIHNLAYKIQREQSQTVRLEKEYMRVEQEYQETLRSVNEYLESMKQKKEAMESKNALLKETLLGLQKARSQLLEHVPLKKDGICEV